MTTAQYKHDAVKQTTESLPQSQNAVKCHIQREKYQTKMWMQALTPIIDEKSPVGNGWTEDFLPMMCD